MTHTPGPWRIQPTSMKGQYLVQGGDIRSGDGFSLQFSEANARLIAAAPELLAALLQLNSWFDRNPEAQIDDTYLKAARAAIAKAEGES